jgi:putative IMPACT (imprinted ancient) family translation regulator
VNLGTGGLIVAYREAAADAIAHSEIIDKLVEERVDFEFPYVMMNQVMRVVKETQARIVSQNFDNTCSISLSIRQSQAEQLRSRLEKLSFE